MKTIAYTIALLIGVVGYNLMPVDARCQESGCNCGSYCVDKNNNWCNSNSNAECECKKGCMHYDGFMLPGTRSLIHCNSCRCSSNPTTGSAACGRNMPCNIENLKAGVDYPSVDVSECEEE